MRSSYLILLVSLVPGCSADELAGPEPAQLSPQIERAIQRSGITDGPIAVIEGTDFTGRHYIVAGRPTAEVGPRNVSLAQDENLLLAFKVHPNGGIPGALSRKEIANFSPSHTTGFTIFCIVGNTRFPVSQAHVDDIHQENVGYSSGGHTTTPGHDLATRPLGSYDRNSGPTDSNGRFEVTYTSSIASGDEKISFDFTITDPSSPCEGQSRHQEFLVIVEVPSLLEIPPSADIRFANEQVFSHPVSDFWFLKATTIQSTVQLGPLYRQAFGVPAPLTAASLVQGGINDIDRNWLPEHWQHRVGTDIDFDDPLNTDNADTLQLMVDLGLDAGFAECQVDNGNHVHCRQVKYE